MQASEKLQKAINYEWEQMNKQEVKTSKPIFHACPPIGWINDPNGLSFYKGECHLFYQYYPYDTQWGPMHWGHCKSEDMVHWEYLPCALAPDMDYDGQGCFSGTAIQDGEEHILMYTSVLDQIGTDGKRLVRQTQSIAKGDGRVYKKSEQNPIIKADILPEGSSKEDFRDPKIWKDGDTYFAVVGSKDAKGEGQLALFSAKDLTDWQFETILDSGKGLYGTMWECPDFFSLEGRQILIVSPMEMKKEGLEFQEGSNSIYFIGDYDREKKEFIRDKGYQIDYGPDFYAPETVETPDGRRVLIGWMQNWTNYLTPADFQWSGMMTVPRELYIENGRLIQVPVRELEKYRIDHVNYENIELLPQDDLRSFVSLDDVKGRCLDMNVKVKGEWDHFEIRLAADETYETLLSYDKKEGILTLDRSHAGMEKDTIPVRSMYVPCYGTVYGKESDAECVLNLRVIMDKYSVEVFANEGRQVMTALLYTPQNADGIGFAADGAGVLSVEKYSIDVSGDFGENR